MRLDRMLRRGVLLAICLPAASLLQAQGTFVMMNGRNHPELRWQEIRTAHFRIFYHEPLREWAYDAASILERFHGPLCRRLDVFPERRTRVYLSDQDQIANGAAVGHDYFFAWIPSQTSQRSFAGSRSWFEEVLVHEYAHILVSWGSRTWVGTLAFPLGLYPPRWLHEGIAQWTAESWNVPRGDQTVGAALLEEGLGRWPRDGRLLYATGNARVRWLAATYGDSLVPRLIRPAGRLGLYSYAAAEKAAYGPGRERLYERFRREMIAFYGERYRRGESPDSIGKPLRPAPAFPQHASRALDGVSWWTGQPTARQAEGSLLRRDADGRMRRIVSGGFTERPCPLPDGRVLVPRWHRASHGSIVQDLGIWEPGSGFRFLTSGARVVEVDTIASRRVIAISESSRGSALAAAAIPERGGAIFLEPLLAWPRGWMPHGLDAAGAGTRAVVSTTRPGGRRDLWGLSLGRVAADSLCLIRDSGVIQNPRWLDEERLAWTAHEEGVANVRAAEWPSGGSLAGERAITSAGSQIELVGVWNDSLLVRDRASREATPTRVVDPRRSPSRLLDERAHIFPTAPAIEPDTTSRAFAAGPFPYRPLSEVRSWFQLPLVGPQSRRVGLGWIGAWAEPLIRHAWGGYLFSARRQASNPDRGLLYITSRWGPWVAAYHLSALLPRRVLNDRLLVERREATGVALLAPLHVESDPNTQAWATGFVGTESRLPRFGGRSLATPLGVPRSWSGLLLGGEAAFMHLPPDGRGAVTMRRGYGMEATARRSIRAWRGGSDFTRLSAQAFAALPLPLPARSSLWIEGGFRGTSSRLPPQEFEGLDADPSHAISPTLPGIDGAVFLRGWPLQRQARFVLHANIETRLQAIPDLGVRAPGLALQGGILAPFVEAGHPWGGGSARFADEKTRVAFGAEARVLARAGPLRIVPAIAYGRRMSRGHPHGHWSWRISTALPLAMPWDPPRLLRALHGGRLQACSF
ncbi:MAG: hypothetical protein FJY88_09435 [Candidatus Eisenbacteria bacterium]|nr:hypothetical protein [Candidatus Eisenbacteria bacterium]